MVCSFLQCFFNGNAINETDLLSLHPLVDVKLCNQQLEELWEGVPGAKQWSKFNKKAFIYHLYDRCILLQRFYQRNQEMEESENQSFQNIDPAFFKKTFQHFLEEVAFFASQNFKQDWAQVKQGFLALGEDGLSINMLHFSCDDPLEARAKTSIKSASVLDRQTAIENPSRLRIDIAPALNVESSKMINILQRGSGYVLTPDFALKLYVLNERRKAGIPTLFSGDTGVGKVCEFSFFIFTFFKKKKKN